MVSIKCPHCLESQFLEFKTEFLREDQDDQLFKISWYVSHTLCASCLKTIIYLIKRKKLSGRNWEEEILVRPRAISRTPLPKEVEPEFTEDYNEACLVLTDSPKASAALSRRCLQHILREKLEVKPDDLSKEIQEVLDRGTLPSHIADGLDAVRNIGNFGTHPIKSKSSGEVVPVEPGEAEWNLDVIESLFDYCFVGPAKLAERKAKLNEKLKEAGKPLLK